MLVAVYQKADWVRYDDPARLKIPERFASRGIERKKVAFVRSAKNDDARRRQHA